MNTKILGMMPTALPRLEAAVQPLKGMPRLPGFVSKESLAIWNRTTPPRFLGMAILFAAFSTSGCARSVSPADGAATISDASPTTDAITTVDACVVPTACDLTLCGDRPGSTNDMDCDSIPDEQDNCLDVANVDQADHDTNGIGDFCEDPDNDGEVSRKEALCMGTDPFNPDTDGDGVADSYDNCPTVPNPIQDPVVCSLCP